MTRFLNFNRRLTCVVICFPVFFFLSSISPHVPFWLCCAKLFIGILNCKSNASLISKFNLRCLLYLRHAWTHAITAISRHLTFIWYNWNLIRRFLIVSRKVHWISWRLKFQQQKEIQTLLRVCLYRECDPVQLVPWRWAQQRNQDISNENRS